MIMIVTLMITIIMIIIGKCMNNNDNNDNNSSSSRRSNRIFSLDFAHDGGHTLAEANVHYTRWPNPENCRLLTLHHF